MPSGKGGNERRAEHEVLRRHRHRLGAPGERGALVDHPRRALEERHGVGLRGVVGSAAQRYNASRPPSNGRNGVSAQTPGAGPSLLRRGTRVLWRFISLHPVPFSAAVAGSVLYALTSVIGAGVLGRVTDRVITPSFAPNGHVRASTVWFYAAAGRVRRVAARVRRRVAPLLRRDDRRAGRRCRCAARSPTSTSKCRSSSTGRTRPASSWPTPTSTSRRRPRSCTRCRSRSGCSCSSSSRSIAALAHRSAARRSSACSSSRRCSC